MGLQKATNAKLPFGMGTLDLTNLSSYFMFIALILGLMVYHVADALGANLANTVLGWMSPYLPSQAGGSNSQSMVRGEI